MEKFYSISLFLLVFLLRSDAQLQPVPETIRLGFIYDGNDATNTPLEAAFIHGINMVNDDRSVLIRSRLTGESEMVPALNSFAASQKVCQMLERGVAAIFGPASDSTGAHVQSISQTFHIPHIEARYDYTQEAKRFAINIHPHPAILSKAYADLVAAFGWKSFVILYEDVESLIRLQGLLTFPKMFDSPRIILRQLPSDSDDYRPLLKEIKRSGELRIVLDCHFDKVEAVLAQADEIGLVNDYYSYLVTSLDIERLDWAPYRYNMVNITGFRLLDTQSPGLPLYLKKWDYQGGDNKGPTNPLFTENILMYDAVRVLAKAMDDMAQIKGFQIPPNSCGPRGREWQDGSTIVDYIRDVEYYGLSGEVFFDEQGFRTNFQLDFLEKRRDRFHKVGVWRPESGINVTLSPVEMERQSVERLENKTLRITTATTTPFIIKKSLPDVPKEALERMSFEEKYEGYVIELVKELATLLKFKYKFHLVMDGKYGSKNEETGEWNGMIRELQDKKADLAVIDLSMTSSRQKAVDFTMPYMTTGVGILFKKRAPPPPNLFSFLSPLSIDVWIYMTTAYLATSVLMFLLARISPQEWESPVPWDENAEELENILNLRNSLWVGIGSFLCQGCDILPKAISTRMVAGMWWFFTLIMISSYTANLAAFLTAAKMDVPINSADDLAKQTKIKYGTYCCGSTNAFFRGSTIPTFQKLNAFMESAKPSVYASSNSEGIDRVRKEDGMYAFFMEAAAIEYHIERKCDLTQIGGLLDSKGYGIALPPESPYTKTVSAGILALQEAGVLQKLKTRWWKHMHGGGQCAGEAGEDNSAQLGLPNLGGVFIVLLGGMIASCFIAIAEFVWKKRILLEDENQSILDEMWKDMKFAINPWESDTKPISPSQMGSKANLDEDEEAGGLPPVDGEGENKEEEHPYGEIAEVGNKSVKSVTSNGQGGKQV